jgi:hypothetical protein
MVDFVSFCHRDKYMSLCGGSACTLQKLLCPTWSECTMIVARSVVSSTHTSFSCPPVPWSALPRLWRPLAAVIASLSLTLVLHLRASQQLILMPPHHFFSQEIFRAVNSHRAGPNFVDGVKRTVVIWGVWSWRQVFYVREECETRGYG